METVVESPLIERPLAAEGYVFVRASEMRAALQACGSLVDWAPFAASWNDLEVDRYLADGSRCRRRRYAVFAAGRTGPAARQPHQAHLQRPEYNVLFGGIERWFEPVAPTTADSASLATVLGFCQQVFGALAPTVTGWHIEVHQFRIEARAGQCGYPTPEGVHRDGVDFVLVLLVNRSNVQSGTTTVFDLKGRALGSFTLTDPLDAALVDDARVAHGVTPVTPLDPALPAYRDVLVVTFRRESDAEGAQARSARL
jgi:hypothetical protein